MAELFFKKSIPWIRESDGTEHEAGDLAQPEPIQEPQPDRIAVLEAKVDLVAKSLAAAGTITKAQIAAAPLPEATKTELTAQAAK